MNSSEGKPPSCRGTHKQEPPALFPFVTDSVSYFNNDVEIKASDVSNKDVALINLSDDGLNNEASGNIIILLRKSVAELSDHLEVTHSILAFNARGVTTRDMRYQRYTCPCWMSIFFVMSRIRR